MNRSVLTTIFLCLCGMGLFFQLQISEIKVRIMDDPDANVEVKVVEHRPPFKRGRFASISSDVNHVEDVWNISEAKVGYEGTEVVGDGLDEHTDFYLSPDSVPRYPSHRQPSAVDEYLDPMLLSEYLDDDGAEPRSLGEYVDPNVFLITSADPAN